MPTSRRLRAALLLAVFPALIGFAFVRWPITAGLERSYGLDLLFKVRGRQAPPPEVCVVSVDDASYIERELDPFERWPRDLHGELVEILRDEGARAVAFDVLFDQPTDPEKDVRFEIGLFDAGNVILGATVERIEDPRYRSFRLVEPLEGFVQSAAAIAVVELPPDDDGTIREGWLAPDGIPGLALAAYELATGDTSYAQETGTRLIDYYGPPRTIETVSLYQALDPRQFLPEGYFKDRIVFVGLSQVAATGIHDSQDAFPTPFTGGRVGSTYGVEIHASLAANLLDGSRLQPMSPRAETAMLLGIALVACTVFVFARPLPGAGAFVVLQALLWILGYQMFARGEVWMPLVIPSLFQLPVAYAAGLAWYYMTTVREREKIRRAFSFYLSPEMIKRIQESSGSLELGGEEVEGTALFTDIAGFTPIAEKMTATETATMLNEYFSKITAKLFETEGTLIKYIGDAVFAIWGAPLPLEDHAARACRAAVEMAKTHGDDSGPAGRLITRIGVHSGSMLVGNLGSDQRFDYTAIGDTINLAARLESLNKSMGTRTLVSGDTLDRAGEGWVARDLGRVRVVGRDDPIRLFELLGVEGDATRPDLATIARFEEALRDFTDRRLDAAETGFREVVQRCGGKDGPSKVYLERIEAVRGHDGGEAWDGVITFTKK